MLYKMFSSPWKGPEVEYVSRNVGEDQRSMLETHLVFPRIGRSCPIWRWLESAVPSESCIVALYTYCSLIFQLALEVETGTPNA
jgi:hypothetical protein